MNKICSWCNTDMGSVPDELLRDQAVTHGICPGCMAAILSPHQYNLEEFIDRLDAKVIVVASDASVICANKKAREFLHKDSCDIVGCLGGDVFECAFAKLPGGCGNTIHCDGCTIRKTVLDTFLSGQCHVKTPAYLIKGTPDINQRIDLLISTEMVMDVVLLEIDRV